MLHVEFPRQFGKRNRLLLVRARRGGGRTTQVCKRFPKAYEGCHSLSVPYQVWRSRDTLRGQGVAANTAHAEGTDDTQTRQWECRCTACVLGKI